MITKSRLQKLFNEGDISKTQMAKFYKSVRAFYTRAMEYGLANLPIKDDLLQNPTFANFKSKEVVHLLRWNILCKGNNAYKV